MCPSDEILRAKFDGELSATEARELESHLAACAGCRERAEALERQAEEVREIFSALPPLPDHPLTDPGIALARLKARQRSAEAEAPSFWGRLFARRWRPAWATLAVIGLALGLFSFHPARTWAQRILAMLRVQKITVVPVDLKVLGDENSTTAGKMLGQMLSDNVVVTTHGEPYATANADEATQQAGYAIRLLSSRTDPPQLMVEGEQAFHMTVDRERAQAILNEAGRSDLLLPASLDGATIAVQVPPLVVARYGHCPSAKHQKDGPPAVDPADVSDCVVVTQVPSPTVSVPPDLNIAELVEVGLQAAGMSADQARAFCQDIDWTSTLVIPLPRFVNSYKTVDVDGVEGTLIDLPRLGHARPAGYTLVWVKNGIIYSVMGFGDSAQAVPLAETLN